MGDRLHIEKKAGKGLGGPRLGEGGKEVPRDEKLEEVLQLSEQEHSRRTGWVEGLRWELPLVGRPRGQCGWSGVDSGGQIRNEVRDAWPMWLSG